MTCHKIWIENNPLIFFLLIHCLWYSARWYGFSLFLFCDNLYGGYRNIHSESKLWYKKCKWLFLAIQNYVILSLVQLTNKNIYMCTCSTVEYCYHHNVNHHCIGFLILTYTGTYFDEFFITKNRRVISCEDNLGSFS